MYAINVVSLIVVLVITECKRIIKGANTKEAVGYTNQLNRHQQAVCMGFIASEMSLDLGNLTAV